MGQYTLSSLGDLHLVGGVGAWRSWSICDRYNPSASRVWCTRRGILPDDNGAEKESVEGEIVLRHAYGISGDRELPAIESEMHDSFGVSALYTTSSIRCQAVKYAFPNFLRFDVELRKTT